MELTVVLSSILETAKTLATLVSKFLSHKKERREAAAIYLDEIAAVLAGFGPKLHAGATYEELSEFCGKLQAFAEQLPHTINDIVGQKEAEELSHMLGLAHDLKQWILLNKQRQKTSYLAVLSEAAGYLRASAISLRAA